MSNIPDNIKKMWEEAAKGNIPMSATLKQKTEKEIGKPLTGTRGEYSGTRDPKTGKLKN
jgi:hypothetical protein